jgi:hypothetical protein
VKRIAEMAVLGLALAAAGVPCALAQNTPLTYAQAAQPSASPQASPANRITGIETNRDMIAAESPTEIVINGTVIVNCGLVVDFGDGTKSNNVASASSPFPLRLTHTYPKIDDVVVRVTGAGEGAAPPCAGMVEAAVHVSPAGSKIEYITLSSGCPEGWLLKGTVNADKSFRCAPIPDASAPTNLIHCIDGMKYFARDGHVGCAHPAGAAPEKFAKAKTPPVKGKLAMANDKSPNKGGPSMAKTKTPPVSDTQDKDSPKPPVKPKAKPAIKSAEAPN